MKKRKEDAGTPINILILVDVVFPILMASGILYALHLLVDYIKSVI